MPYAQDGTISYENIITRYNTDLANTLGNLVNRTIAMVKKYFDGKIPARAELDETDSSLMAFAENTVISYKEKMDEFRLADACDLIMGLAKRSNKYIDETTPWTLAKEEAKKPRLGTVLYNLLECLRISVSLLIPFMPDSAEKARVQIGAAPEDFTWEKAGQFGILPADVTVHKGEALFPRIDMEKELAILRAKLPHVDDRLCAQVALAVQKLRSNEVILKKPSIAETLDWAAALDALGIRELTPDALRKTAGFVLKNNEDMAALDAEEMGGCHCGGCEGHHHG